jgi:GTPase
VGLSLECDLLESAVVVHVDFSAASVQQDALEEFKHLVFAAGADVTCVIMARRDIPDPRYFVGSGKVAEIKIAIESCGASLVLFNHSLNPGQQRNLERELHCHVVDRTQLILDIFAQRARSYEGKLQVELAQLQHLSTRLIRGWTHLERQKGGIGLRGPGETQLETDRRLLRARVSVIEARLEKVRQQRSLSRQARQKASLFTISLVGYTNAGKSTLFNRLTGADVLVADQLFATLDPTLRRVEFPNIGTVIVADTVGFIRHLPHDLVEAFQATLEETQQADLLLHVIDVTDEAKHAQIQQVNAVLEQIGAQSVPRIEVFNKIDQIDKQASYEKEASGQIQRVCLSAATGEGMDYLYDAIQLFFSRGYVEKMIILQANEAKLRAKLYDLNAVLWEKIDDQGCYHLSIRLAHSHYPRLISRHLLRAS